MWRWLRQCWLCLVPLMLVGCPPPLEQEHAGSYVGRLAGSDAFVAIVTNGTDVRAYVCDGAGDGQLTVSEWFKGTAHQNEFYLTSLSGATEITAQIEADKASGGFVSGDGTLRMFEATRVDGDASFYLFKNFVGSEFYWAGWIVLPDGDQRGSLLLGTSRTANTSLNLSTGTATLSGAGTVSPGKLTSDNVIQGFGGCFPCP